MELKKNSLGAHSFLNEINHIAHFIVCSICFLSILICAAICFTTDAVHYISEFLKILHSSYLEAGFSDKQAQLTFGGFTIFYFLGCLIKSLLQTLEQRIYIAKALLFFQKIDIFLSKWIGEIKSFLYGATFLALIIFSALFSIFYSYYPEAALSIFFSLLH